MHLVLEPDEMKDRIDVLDWDKLSMYDQDDLLQLASVARETLVELEPRIMSIRIPVDLETLPMMLKVGIRLNSDLNHTGHGSKLLHLSKLKSVRFSYPFISKGTCPTYTNDSEKPEQGIFSSVKKFVEQQQYVFDNLWK